MWFYHVMDSENVKTRPGLNRIRGEGEWIFMLATYNHRFTIYFRVRSEEVMRKLGGRCRECILDTSHWTLEDDLKSIRKECGGI